MLSTHRNLGFGRNFYLRIGITDFSCFSDLNLLNICCVGCNCAQFFSKLDGYLEIIILLLKVIFELESEDIVVILIIYLRSYIGFQFLENFFLGRFSITLQVNWLCDVVHSLHCDGTTCLLLLAHFCTLISLVTFSATS